MAITNETKVLVAILVATVAIIVGGAFIMGGGSGNGTVADPVAEAERLVRSDDPVYANGSSGDVADATVTVVEFGDFECPACIAVHPLVKQLKDQNADKSVRFVFRQFPLTQAHEFAQKAAEASLAAQAQGKFWEYHDRLFESQGKLDRDSLITYARDLGLDVDRFTRELDEGAYEDAVSQDVTDGTIVGVRGTPTFYINVQQYTGQYSINDFQAAIDAALGQ